MFGGFGGFGDGNQQPNQQPGGFPGMGMNFNVQSTHTTTSSGAGNSMGGGQQDPGKMS